jgi:hypothetical protein
VYVRRKFRIKLKTENMTTEEIKNTDILRNVQSLLNEHFYVPKYQRGYRWTKNKLMIYSTTLTVLFQVATKVKTLGIACNRLW